MRTTTIYIVTMEDELEHEVACPTLEEALEARANCSRPIVEGAIKKVTVPVGPIRQVLCDMFNRAGFERKSEKLADNLTEEEATKRGHYEER